MSLQLDMLGGPAVPLQHLQPITAPKARRADPSTSHAAADQARDLTKRHHSIILACLRAHGPMGKDAIAARANLTGVQVCRRLAELGPDGSNMIKPTGKTVVSTSGRGEREWQVIA